MAKAKKRKRKWIWLRYRKNDLDHNLLVAAQRWIHANGGSATIIGGISVIVMPDERPFCYRVAVGALGKRPEPKKPEAKHG